MQRVSRCQFWSYCDGATNVPVNTLEFIQLKRELMTKVLHPVDTGQPRGLHLKVEAVPRPKPGLPDELKVTHWLDSGENSSEYFSNFPFSEEAIE